MGLEVLAEPPVVLLPVLLLGVPCAERHDRLELGAGGEPAGGLLSYGLNSLPICCAARDCCCRMALEHGLNRGLVDLETRLGRLAL